MNAFILFKIFDELSGNYFPLEYPRMDIPKENNYKKQHDYPIRKSVTTRKFKTALIIKRNKKSLTVLPRP